MTDYRSRRIKAIRVSCDERVEAITEPQVRTIQGWLALAKFDWMGFVHGKFQGTDIEFSMIVDDEGHDSRRPWNPRAQFLSGYPIQSPILGDALFVCRDWADDGYDIVDLTDRAIKWLQDPIRAEEYAAWSRAPENHAYKFEYRQKFPQPPVSYPKREG